MPTDEPSKRKSILPTIPTSLMLKKSNEALSDFERTFNDRVMDIFAENRRIDVEEFKKNAECFLNIIRSNKIDLNWGEGGESRYVTITRLMKILKTSPQSIKDLLPHNTVSNFVKITNYNLTIDITLLEELVRTVIHAEESYIKLLPFSENSTEISSYSLQDFVATHFIPIMIEEPENPVYYTAYAVGTIFFLLGARRRDCVYLKDLLASTLLLQLEECIHAENHCLSPPKIDVFTVAQFRTTLSEFRFLDSQRKGLLAPADLKFFRDGIFNEVFTKRIFEISITYEDGRIDFKAFVDFVTALKFRHTTASAKYHFEILDLKDDGLLDEEEIRSILQNLPDYVPEDNSVNPEVATAELRDMMRLNQNGITLEEFLANRMNSTFAGFLSNSDDYMKYERREQ
ncbi:Serine/threonine-protein phosphatase 2A regulatory subunit rsa-1 [Caenorhabditis elegans]|uniref:Isoform b of Serine/threonine-protein phosphatase 2A regulatory subunit rsa-1 n=1 Tax=Caenorhabditis elegans TaxID=6239 RepID=O02217-2|nr:Serine/threonine-protein phosphatase 2A regulatory subunit rsa-1 [Caenorhabditis elegans]CAN99683.1 Serine/threonine-protein phosphatase 2A regulatory subunit rsa-1 [Caenorhabditis elegans]|eukprot:NP_001122424.1 Serine/threonine-protein phosphatase 2A regulatory subunit rsa-1 [Caenorhabditis elegans]